jgi:hypothetical protein
MASVTVERAVRHVLVHHQRLTPPETRHARPLAGGLFPLLVCVRHRRGGLAISCGWLAAVIAARVRQSTADANCWSNPQSADWPNGAPCSPPATQSFRHPRHGVGSGGSDLGYRQLGHPQGYSPTRLASSLIVMP